MNYKDLEGRVYHIDDLLPNQIEKIRKLPYVESIDSRTDASPTDVSTYYRLVLKEKRHFWDNLPDDLTAIVGRLGATYIGDPAALLDYQGPLIVMRASPDKPIKPEHIAKIEEEPDVLYVQDMTESGRSLYFIGFKVDEQEMSVIKERFNETLGIYLIMPEKLTPLAA